MGAPHLLLGPGAI